ncbi:hypothetical protein EVAR_35983_1 [Eumeta japonica]|uniref:Uncharacterized protein n=1 Tax=Eumeta variegata TaxID=151549 RepID=A0A4C1WSG6_EUMVA|nr:hypothetical protein EVAR_35983_1 [Eumeta japonica]
MESVSSFGLILGQRGGLKINRHLSLSYVICFLFRGRTGPPPEGTVPREGVMRCPRRALRENKIKDPH